MSVTASLIRNNSQRQSKSAASVTSSNGNCELTTTSNLSVDSERANAVNSRHRSIWSFVETLSATLAVFGLFFIQAILVARILGPAGRGEFGAILYFPRDLLLYVGLWGSVELMTAWAARQNTNPQVLKVYAVRLALLTGFCTATLAFSLATIVLTATGKAHLLPWCAIVALYLPLEHLQLTVSAVDRGAGAFRRYNRDRVLFAASFPLLAFTVFGLGWNQWLPMGSLQLLCCLWVAARLIGILPTIYDMRGFLAKSDTTAQASEIETMIPDRHTLRSLLSQGSSYAWSVLANEMFERLDLLLIIIFASLENAGQYFVSLPIATLLVLVPNTVSLFAFNWGAQPNKVMSFPGIVALFLGLLLVQSICCVALMLALPWLITTFYGPDFQLAIAFSQWLLPIAIVRGLVQVVDGFAKGAGLVSWTIGARIFSLLCAFSVAMIFYPYLGLFSIPLGMGIGQVLSLGTIGWGCFREIVRRQRVAEVLRSAKI